MNHDLSGKCALITGSVQGLGLAAARRFAAAGCHIILNGFASSEKVTTLRSSIEKEYQVQTLYCGADLRHPGQIEQMITEAEQAFNAVGVLVNNAVVRHTAPVESFSPQKWDEALAVNLSAAFHTIRCALPKMRQANWGRIINVSSIYGQRGTVNRVGYVTTKTALIGLTRAVALETLAQNITCNAICPGTTESPVHEQTIQEMIGSSGLSRSEAERRFLAGRQPSGRLISADDVAELMLFLCGPASSQITGAVFPIDGGWSVQ